jgi:hypothetical protein
MSIYSKVTCDSDKKHFKMEYYYCSLSNEPCIYIGSIIIIMLHKNYMLRKVFEQLYHKFLTVKYGEFDYNESVEEHIKKCKKIISDENIKRHNEFFKKLELVDL